MGTILGLDCELFHNSGTFDTPVWAACEAARDVTLTVETAEVDASRRGSGGWRQNETTLRSGSFTTSLVKDKDDAVFVAIEAAYQANAAMELAVLDGSNAIGTDWLDAKWKVRSWQENQELEGVVTIDAEFGIAPDADLSPTFGTGVLPTTRS